MTPTRRRPEHQRAARRSGERNTGGVVNDVLTSRRVTVLCI